MKYFHVCLQLIKFVLPTVISLALSYWLSQLEQFQVPVSAQTVSAFLWYRTCVSSCTFDRRNCASYFD